MTGPRVVRKLNVPPQRVPGEWLRFAPVEQGGWGSIWLPTDLPRLTTSAVERSQGYASPSAWVPVQDLLAGDRPWREEHTRAKAAEAAGHPYWVDRLAAAGVLPDLANMARNGVPSQFALGAPFILAGLGREPLDLPPPLGLARGGFLLRQLPEGDRRLLAGRDLSPGHANAARQRLVKATAANLGAVVLRSEADAFRFRDVAWAGVVSPADFGRAVLLSGSPSQRLPAEQGVVGAELLSGALGGCYVTGRGVKLPLSRFLLPGDVHLVLADGRVVPLAVAARSAEDHPAVSSLHALDPGVWSRIGHGEVASSLLSMVVDTAAKALGVGGFGSVGDVIAALLSVALPFIDAAADDLVAAPSAVNDAPSSATTATTTTEAPSSDAYTAADARAEFERFAAMYGTPLLYALVTLGADGYAKAAGVTRDAVLAFAAPWPILSAYLVRKS